MSKMLIAFFSCSGVTKRVAMTLANIVKADLYEIVPETPYSAADLDWTNKNSRSTIEMRSPSSRPAIRGGVSNMDAYETVLVGFPIWWYVAPTIINTFLERYDFSGKTLVPFATSGGSGFGQTMEKLRGSVSSATVMKEGKLLNGNPSPAALKAWLESLGWVG